MRKYEMLRYQKLTLETEEELNSALREFLWNKVPKKVLFALTVSHEGDVNENTVSLNRRISIGKQHWMYSEFIEHNGHMLPKWYVNAKLQNDKLVSSS
jgi:hypothetical protein